MITLTRIGCGASVAKLAALVLAVAALGACTNTARFGGQPEEAAAAPAASPPATESTPEPASAQPPQIDLAGKWKLSAAAGAACLLILTDNPGATEGKIAPAGGCPGNFFTSRKWTYENGALVIRDFKGQALAELSFADGRFEGKNPSGDAITLARP